MNAVSLKDAPAASASVGLKTLDEEVDLDALPLSGELPGWLQGSLVRVTPALLDLDGGPVRHWFDGLAMLNLFAMRAGGVSYSSRFLDSEDYRHAREHGEVRGLGFATDPCRSLFKRVTAVFAPEITDNCNVNVTRLGERWIAMTEAPIAIEFDPATLATLGPIEWPGATGEHIASAHPHHDAERGEMVSYAMRFGPLSSYRLFAVPDGTSKRRRVAKLQTREPAYMHSFGLTERYAVLFEQPLVVDPLRFVLDDKPFIENYRWKPERGTRFLVVDRETGSLAAKLETEAFFTFHQVNSFEEDGELVVDLVAYDDASVIDQLYLEQLREAPVPGAGGRLRRYRLSLDGGPARREDLFDEPLELPRIAYRTHNGRPYRYVYAAGQGDGPGPGFSRLLKVDVGGGPTREWAEDHCFPGEPVFVPAPGAGAEDEGVVLSVVLDAAAGRSFLLVLDAGDMHELARAEAPHHIPFGFHGDFA